MIFKRSTPTRVIMRVLAIDPGFGRLGIAVLEGDASKPVYIWGTCVEPARSEQYKRLATVYTSVADAVHTYKPDLLAIETLFFNTNRKTALGVAEARGAVLAAAGVAGLPVREYSPQLVKLAVTGYGNADKKAVMEMVLRLISLPEQNRLDDEYDAIALGIAALAERYPHK